MQMGEGKCKDIGTARNEKPTWEQQINENKMHWETEKHEPKHAIWYHVWDATWLLIKAAKILPSAQT